MNNFKEYEAKVIFHSKEMRDEFLKWMSNSGEQDFWQDVEDYSDYTPVSSDEDETKDDYFILYESEEVRHR